MYDFDVWDISHESMMTFIKQSRSSGNKKAEVIEKEILETICNFQSSFHSAINAFTALERKHDKVLGTIKPSGEERRLSDPIVRIIVLLKRWLPQIEQGYCMGIMDKKL